MPIHDWTRGGDWLFHSFQLDWLVELSSRLNNGALPSSCFALNETIDHRSQPGFLELTEPEKPFKDPKLPGDIRFLDDQPPRTRWVFSSDEIEYASRAVTVRYTDAHDPVAAILIVCQQDKRTSRRVEKLVARAIGALSHDIHLMIVDLFPPSKREPQGIHKAIWDEIKDETCSLSADKPLTLASYTAGSIKTAYVEPVAVGDVLPDMPLFLKPNVYVSVPLEATYQAAWATFPKELKPLLGAPL